MKNSSDVFQIISMLLSGTKFAKKHFPHDMPPTMSDWQHL